MQEEFEGLQLSGDFGTHFRALMERDQLPAPGWCLPQLRCVNRIRTCLSLDLIKEFSLPKFSLKPPPAGLKFMLIFDPSQPIWFLTQPH